MAHVLLVSSWFEEASDLSLETSGSRWPTNRFFEENQESPTGKRLNDPHPVVEFWPITTSFSEDSVQNKNK